MNGWRDENERKNTSTYDNRRKCEGFSPLRLLKVELRWWNVKQPLIFPNVPTNEIQPFRSVSMDEKSMIHHIRNLNVELRFAIQREFRRFALSNDEIDRELWVTEIDRKFLRVQRPKQVGREFYNHFTIEYRGGNSRQFLQIASIHVISKEFQTWKISTQSVRIRQKNCRCW